MEKAVLPLFDNLPASAPSDEIRFDGSDYDPSLDDARLHGQIARVQDVMSDGEWRTLEEIQQRIVRRFRVTDPLPSVSAQLRHLRKSRFGGFVVQKRRRGHAKAGLFEYRIAPVSEEDCRLYADSVNKT